MLIDGFATRWKGCQYKSALAIVSFPLPDFRLTYAVVPCMQEVKELLCAILFCL